MIVECSDYFHQSKFLKFTNHSFENADNTENIQLLLEKIFQYQTEDYKCKKLSFIFIPFNNINTNDVIYGYKIELNKGLLDTKPFTRSFLDDYIEYNFNKNIDGIYSIDTSPSTSKRGDYNFSLLNDFFPNVINSKSKIFFKYKYRQYSQYNFIFVQYFDNYPESILPLNTKINIEISEQIFQYIDKYFIPNYYLLNMFTKLQRSMLQTEEIFLTYQNHYLEFENYYLKKLLKFFGVKKKNLIEKSTINQMLFLRYLYTEDEEEIKQLHSFFNSMEEPEIREMIKNMGEKGAKVELVYDYIDEVWPNKTTSIEPSSFHAKYIQPNRNLIIEEESIQRAINKTNKDTVLYMGKNSIKTIIMWDNDNSVIYEGFSERFPGYMNGEDIVQYLLKIKSLYSRFLVSGFFIKSVEIDKKLKKLQSQISSIFSEADMIKFINKYGLKAVHDEVVKSIIINYQTRLQFNKILKMWKGKSISPLFAPYYKGHLLIEYFVSLEMYLKKILMIIKPDENKAHRKPLGDLLGKLTQYLEIDYDYKIVLDEWNSIKHRGNLKENSKEYTEKEIEELERGVLALFTHLIPEIIRKNQKIENKKNLMRRATD